MPAAPQLDAPAVPLSERPAGVPRARGLADLAVDLTLAPVALGEFRELHLDRAPLLVAREQPGRFDHVLSLASAERLVCGGSLRTPAVRVVRDGRQLPFGEFSDDAARAGTLTGVVDVERVAAEFAGGATIILQWLQRHWPPAARYCRGLELAFGFPTWANAYWTPAGAQGFAIHHDTHDVFILQVAGHKHWRVYAPLLELPLETQGWSDQLGELGEPVLDVELAPGDTLYLPRGWPHHAQTSGEQSLHVTTGLQPPRRLDALHAALDACAAQDVELRRALDAGGALPPDLLARVTPFLEPAAVAGRARRAFVDERRPLREDALRARDPVAADDPVERRDTVIADLDGTALRFEGRAVRFPAHTIGALTAACVADGPFTAATLPGPLDQAGRLELVRRLLQEGFLRRSAHTGTPASPATTGQR